MDGVVVVVAVVVVVVVLYVDSVYRYATGVSNTSSLFFLNISLVFLKHCTSFVSLKVS